MTLTPTAHKTHNRHVNRASSKRTRSPRRTGRPPVVEGGQDARMAMRLSSAELAQLRDFHAASFPAHRLSFNRWAVQILLEHGRPKKR